MRAWPAVLMGSLLLGQEAMPVKHPLPPFPTASLKLRKFCRTPQEMVQAMVAQEQAQRSQPGATVEVVGHDDEAALKLLSLKVAQKVRLEFRNSDKLQARELCEVMHQDPSHPSPILSLPMLAGAKAKTMDDQWLR
jgi:hypothetical protein